MIILILYNNKSFFGNGWYFDETEVLCYPARSFCSLFPEYRSFTVRNPLMTARRFQPLDRKEVSDTQDTGLYHVFCPTFGKRKTMTLSHPAGDLCPVCRRLRGKNPHECAPRI